MKQDQQTEEKLTPYERLMVQAARDQVEATRANTAELRNLRAPHAEDATLERCRAGFVEADAQRARTGLAAVVWVKMTVTTQSDATAELRVALTQKTVDGKSLVIVHEEPHPADWKKVEDLVRAEILAEGPGAEIERLRASGQHAAAAQIAEACESPGGRGSRGGVVHRMWEVRRDQLIGRLVGKALDDLIARGAVSVIGPPSD